MICANCPLCTDEPCGLYETHAIKDSKDGYSRCNVPYNKIKKLDEEYTVYCAQTGIDMGIEHTCEIRGIPIEKVIDICKHMVGLDYHAPYHRNGKAYYKAYRNYFDASRSGNIYLDVLPSYIVDRQESGSGMWYTLTASGLDWLGRQLKIKISEME